MALKKYHGWLVQKIFKVSATGPEDSGSLLSPREGWAHLCFGMGPVH